ncbi:MAG: hypothetical protein JXQ90_04035 [Cyclobacteriaceae bacterium]
MNRKWIYIVVCLVLYLGAKGQSQGEIENAEFIIEKDQVITLEKVPRTFIRSDNFKPETSEINVQFNIKDPRIILESFSPVINIAKLAELPNLETSDHLLKIGFGSFISPIVDYKFNGNINESNKLLINAYHESFARGPVFQERSGEMINSIGLQHLFNASDHLTINSSLDFFRKGFNRYGLYGPDSAVDVTAVDTMDIGSTYQMLSLNAALNYAKGSVSSRIQLDYNMGWLDAVNSANDQNIILKADVSKTFENRLKLTIPFDFEADLFSSVDTAVNRNWVGFRPNIQYGRDKIEFKLGAGAYYSTDSIGDGNLYLFPDIGFKYHVNEMNALYINATGGFQKNQLNMLWNMNQWLLAMPTQSGVERVAAYIGAQGILTKGFDYDFAMGIRKVDHPQLMVNDISNYESFGLISDTSMLVKQVKWMMRYKAPKILGVKGELNFNAYEMASLTKAWHLPELTFKLTATLDLANKIKISPYYYLMSGVYARNQNLEAEQLDVISDLGIDATYQVKDNFSIFFRARNLLGNENSRYFYYPTRQFDIKGGISISF